MSNPANTPADIALAAWQAAGIKGKLLGKYKLRWNTWQAWCASRGIDPLGATHDEYALFVSEHNQPPRSREQQASALHRPYLYVGKISPAHSPPTQNAHTEREYLPKLERFASWSKAHGTDNLPAQPQDVVAFLTELATTHPKSYVKQALTAISRMHTLAGYAPPSREPEVASALKNIRGTPRQLVTDTDHAAARDRRIAQWKDWCLEQGFDPAYATAAHFLNYFEQLGTGLAANTLKLYRSQIARLYEDRSITHNPQSQALIDAALSGAETKMKRNVLKQQTDDEIQLILEAEAQLMEPDDSHLSIEKRKRIARAMAHANVTDQTMQRYVRYAWIPFKGWCEANGTSPQQATSGDVSAFLCEIADEKGPTYASGTFDGLLHVFNRVRPSDNPADVASVRKTLRGLQRERPSPPRQATPIGTEELTILINTAHNPKYRESSDQTRLRAAVDIALLCTMYDTGIRGAEAAEAEWDGLQDAPDHRGGSVLTIRRSKTDQLHEGAVLYLTQFTTEAIKHMQQVRHDLGIADTGDSRIFRLCTDSIYRRIRAACRHAALEGRYTMHSPRVGTAQDLVIDNFSDIQIMNILRWKSQSSLTHYTKGVKATKNAVAQREKRRNQNTETPKRIPDDYGIPRPNSKARLGH